MRTYQPRPGPWGRRLLRAWLALLALLCLSHAWLAPPLAYAAGQLLWVAGLVLAFYSLLLAIALFDGGQLLRLLLLLGLGFVLVGPLERAAQLGGLVRLAWARGDYQEAMAAHRLGARVRCDCVLSDSYAGFRWHRLPGGWTGLAYDPDGRLRDDGAALGGTLVDRRPLPGPWALVRVARPESKIQGGHGHPINRERTGSEQAPAIDAGRRSWPSTGPLP